MLTASSDDADDDEGDVVVGEMLLRPPRSTRQRIEKDAHIAMGKLVRREGRPCDFYRAVGFTL